MEYPESDTLLPSVKFLQFILHGLTVCKSTFQCSKDPSHC